MKHLIVFLLALLFTSQADVANGLTALPRDFDQLVARADTVFKGTVSNKASQWVGERAERHIVTFVTWQVEETYKGSATSTQTLRFLGGTVGGDTMEVPDMPRFEVGQRAILFVVNNGKQFCPLVGIDQGRFHVVKDAATGRERVFTDGFLPVVNTKAIGHTDEKGYPLLQRYARTVGAQAMTTDDFRDEILSKVAALAH